MNRRKFLVASAATSALCAVHSSAYAGLFEESQQAATPKERRSPALVEPTADQFREKLRNEPLRPQFHLLAKANWMNDPCAPRFFRGRYHMFFQFNPGAAVWGDMHWSHAVSDDMVRWRHLPVALSPTPGWADADGC